MVELTKPFVKSQALNDDILLNSHKCFSNKNSSFLTLNIMKKGYQEKLTINFSDYSI